MLTPREIASTLVETPVMKVEVKDFRGHVKYIFLVLHPVFRSDYGEKNALLTAPERNKFDFYQYSIRKVEKIFASIKEQFGVTVIDDPVYDARPLYHNTDCITVREL